MSSMISDAVEEKVGQVTKQKSLNRLLPLTLKAQTQPPVLRYGMAILISMLALLLKLILGPFIGPSPFLLFLAAVMFSAWYGGLGPGLLASLFVALASSYFFLPPLYSLTISGIANQLQFLLFLLEALLISALSSALRTTLDEHKLAEEKISALNLELEQRVVERTVQLEAANKELEAFNYTISHDLRGPLTSIDGFSQILLEDHADKLDEEGKDCLQQIHAASQRMWQRINDIRDLSYVTHSEMHHEKIDLSALAQTVAAELHQRQPERRVKFIIAQGVTASGDAELLQIVLENLLGNAWKYTSKRSLATIKFGVTQYDGKPAYFVRDDGAGFDMAYADKLFDAFQRLHTAAEFDGTGIGLATVQRIIHRHGGQIWAEAEVGKGATFYFTL